MLVVPQVAHVPGDGHEGRGAAGQLLQAGLELGPEVRRGPRKQLHGPEEGAGPRLVGDEVRDAQLPGGAPRAARGQ